MTRRRRVVDEVIRDEVLAYLTGVRPKSEWQSCFNCGEPFKKKGTRLYCDKRCGRMKHYLKFNVREIRAGTRRLR